MCCCFRICGRKCCRCCDYALVSSLIAGGVGTATTTTLHYQGIIHDWMWVVIPSGITVLSIFGLVVRGLCKSGLVNKNRQVINIINKDDHDIINAEPVLSEGTPIIIGKKIKRNKVVPMTKTNFNASVNEYKPKDVRIDIEKRMDITDGRYYTKQEFIDFYGGTDEWNQSYEKDVTV